jgi:hypothetical protein
MIMLCKWYCPDSRVGPWIVDWIDVPLCHDGQDY